MKHEYFWSLILEHGWTQASIWKVEDKNVLIVAVSKISSYEPDTLVEVVDAALTDAIHQFPESEREPSKTVFGVPPSWVKEGQIEKKYLDQIREICSRLSLSPSGFVVISEALAHATKVQEGSPLTGVVLGVSQNLLDISIFKLGNMVGSVTVGRSTSIFEDVVEGLTRFGETGPLPTRFLIFGEENIEDSNQELITSDWQGVKDRGLTFLHNPQFEIVSAQKRAIAVSIAGASEMGEITSVDTGSFGQEANTKKSVVSDINFEEENITATNDLSAKDIGFVIDEDIEDHEASMPKTAVSGITDDEEEPDRKEKKLSTPKLSLPHFNLPRFSFFKKRKSQDESHVSRITTSSPRKKFIALGFLLVFIGIIAGFGWYWWSVPKATITIFVSPQQIDESDVIILDRSVETANIEENIYPAKTLETEVSIEKQKASTGSITVGDKATGSVTVRNGTDDPIQLDAGDTLIGPNNLRFVVNESASVSAALSPSEPGEATVGATAADIGGEYNIAQDETFTVSGFSKSEVDAKVTTAFSGGTSRDIVAVAQADLNALLSELTAELKRRGITDLEEKAGKGVFVPESVETDIIEEEYSASVGDEAANVSLTLTMKVSGIAIDEPTIETLTQNILSDQVPAGFKLKKENVDTNFDLIDEFDDGAFEFDVLFTANLLPETNVDDITNKIKGKYPTDAEKILSTLAGFKKANITITPRFPGRLGIIPYKQDNISIQIEAER